jgi:hypothetical protein
VKTRNVFWVLALVGLSWLAGCVVAPARPVVYEPVYYDGPAVVYYHPYYYGGYYHRGYYR